MLVGCLTTVMVFPAAADIVGGTPATGNYIEALSNAYAQKYSSGAEKIEISPRNCSVVWRESAEPI